MGRKKIKIEKIECATKRRMTCLKRTRGILKKAKELSVLCEADVALIIIPPAGKAQHFSTRPGIEQVIERFNANILKGNKARMCSGNKEQCKAWCCGTNPSSGVQSAHGHIPIKHPLVYEATQGREQLQIKRVSFVQMEDPCPTPVSVPWHFSSQQRRIEPMLQPFNQNVLYMPEELMLNVQVSGTNPSSGVQSAHLHVPMQQTQVLEATRCRQNEHMQGMPEKPFDEMEDPSAIATSVSDPFKLSEIRGPDGTSDCMQGPLVRGREMHFPSGAQVWEAPQGREQVHMQRTPFVAHPSEASGPDTTSNHMHGPQVGLCEMRCFSGVQPFSSMSDMPGGEACELQQLSNQSSRTQQMLPQFNQNIIHNMPEEEITVYASHQTLQQLQEDETGICSDEDLAGFMGFVDLLKSEDPALSPQQIENKPPHANPSSCVQQQTLENGQVNWTPGTNPSSSMQSAHCNMPMQQLQMFRETQGREQMHMQGVPSVEMEHPSLIQMSVPRQFPHGTSDYKLNQMGDGYEMPFHSDVQLPSSL